MDDEIRVKVGEIVISHNPKMLSCIGLGSCVAVSLYCERKNTGGLAHCMLPSYKNGRDKDKPGKYVDTAIYTMIDDLEEEDIRKRSLVAKLVGGAQMFSNFNSDSLNIGERNVICAKKILKEENIPLKAEKTGGNIGRTIKFDLSTGNIDIRESCSDHEII